MTPEIGRSYIGADDVIRWFTHRSDRGYWHCLWLAQGSGTWYNGGSYHETLIERSGVLAKGLADREPKPGEEFKICGPTGIVDSRVWPVPQGRG